MEGAGQNIVESNENLTQNNESTTQNVSFQELLSGSQPTPVIEQTQETTIQEDQTSQELTNLEPAEETSKVDDNAVLEYLKSKGKEVSSIDDLFKDPEVKEVEINPYDSLLSDEEKAYLDFKKQTGGTKEDFQALNTDWDSVPSIELAKAKIQKETGLNLTSQEVSEYIEQELGIDLNEGEEKMTISEKIKMKTYLKNFIESQKAEQIKFKSSIQDVASNQQAEQATQPEIETVTLDDGTVMKKQDYDKRLNEYEAYKSKNKDAVNSVTDYSFNITIDDKGTEKELSFNYEVSSEDRHGMLSITEDTSKYINQNYVSESGFNHKQFNEDMFWSRQQNREKVIKALLQQARATAIEEVMKERGNINLQTHSGLQVQNHKEGVKTMTIQQILES
jgi:hypothetical protein